MVLVKRSEAELFEAQSASRYQEAFGPDYAAYLALKTKLEQTGQPFRALTTDPRMPYYDRDERFVFNIPQNLADLQNFTHLIIAPWWSPQDYQRLGLSPEQVQNFLTQSTFLEKIAEINGYTAYRILP